MKSMMLEMLGHVKQSIQDSYYDQETALADFYDSRGCFCPDTVVTRAIELVQEQTGLSGGDVLVLLYENQEKG